MLHRQPFKLTKFLVIYNISQVFACLFFLINSISLGLRPKMIWQCNENIYTYVPLMKLLYFTFLIKAIELIETVCFMLRKNFRQMSFLHIYHHVSTLIFSYIAVTRKGSKLIT
jgi:hypothetical protein